MHPTEVINAEKLLRSGGRPRHHVSVHLLDSLRSGATFPPFFEPTG